MSDTTKKDAMDASVVRSLVKVRMVVHSMGGQRKVQHLGRELEGSKGLREGKASVTLEFLPEEAMGPINANGGKLQSAWNSRTLLWERGGWDCVTAEAYLPLMDAINPLIEERRQLVDDAFGTEAKYETLRAQVERDLGKEWDPSKFPSMNGIADRFAVDLYSEPIIATGDVRIQGLTEAAQEMIERQYAAQVSVNLSECMQQVVWKLTSLASEMKARVGKKEQKRTKYSRLIEIAQETLEPMRTFAAKFDPTGNLTAVLERGIQTMTTFTPVALRESAWARRAMEKATDQLLADLENL